MNESQTLLAEFAKSGSEAAFREIVARYLDLTYSTALRLVEGDVHRAQDVTQVVFTDLARMARNISKETMLGGWLHRHTCFVAKNMLRGERRRNAREKQAVEMNAWHETHGSTLSELTPILDEAIDQLSTADRTAIMLRFFERRDFQSVGAVLGTSENTARMRVNRALEKLQAAFKKRGIACSAAGLGAMLGADAVAAAPAGLLSVVTHAALVATSAATVIATGAGAGSASTFLKLISMTKLQVGILSAVALLSVATTSMLERQSSARLNRENESLRQRVNMLETNPAGAGARSARSSQALLPHLPSTDVQNGVASRETADGLPSVNSYIRFKDKQPKLTLDQLRSYLESNGRNAASLLSAYRAVGDPSLLAEAIQNFPNDSQVAFEAAFKKDAKPEERRQWLDALKKADPNNSLPNYLAAVDNFRAGQSDQALQELAVASAKTQFQDYTAERSQDTTEAYLGAGYSLADAKTLASMQLLLPQLVQTKELGRDLLDLAKTYRQGGDESSAETVLQMAASLGQRYSNGPASEPLVSQLVGMYVERTALTAMDPVGAVEHLPQEMQTRLNGLVNQEQAIRDLAQKTDAIMPLVSDQDLVVYKDRWISFGEEAAGRWLINKYGQK